MSYKGFFYGILIILDFEKKSKYTGTLFFRLPHGGPESHDVQRRDIDDIRYDREDPCTGVKQILTGFTKWTLRYISDCSGQREHAHQVGRLGRWHKILNKG